MRMGRLPDAPVINLPGVGRNMQDRYEVTVISELNARAIHARGVSFRPGDLERPGPRYMDEGRRASTLQRRHARHLFAAPPRCAMTNPSLTFHLRCLRSLAAITGTGRRELFRGNLGGEQRTQVLELGHPQGLHPNTRHCATENCIRLICGNLLPFFLRKRQATAGKRSCGAG